MTLVEVFLRELAEIAWRTRPIEDLVRLRFARVAADVVRAGSLERWGRERQARVVDDERSGVDWITAQVRQAGSHPDHEAERKRARKHDAARPRHDDLSPRLHALARLLTTTRQRSRRSALAEASRLFTWRPVSLTLQAQYESDFIGVLQLILDTKSGFEAERAIARLSRVQHHVNSDTSNPIPQSELYFDRAEPSAWRTVAVAWEAGFVQFNGTEPIWTDVTLETVEPSAIPRFADLLPSHQRRHVRDQHLIGPQALALIYRLQMTGRHVKELPEVEPNRHDVSLNPRRFRVLNEPWLRGSVDEDNFTYEARCSLEATFQHPLHKLLIAASMVTKQSTSVDSAMATLEQDLHRRDRPPSLIRTTLPSFAYLRVLIASTRQIPDLQSAAGLHVIAIRFWLTHVKTPSDTDVSDLLTALEALASTTSRSITRHWTEAVKHLLRVGIPLSMPVQRRYDELLVRSRGDRTFFKLPIERQRRLVPSLRDRFRSMAQRRLTETDGGAAHDLIEVAPHVLGRLLVSSEPSRAAIRNGIRKGDPSLRDGLIENLPHLFATQGKVRVAVELALRSDLDLLPKLLSILDHISFTLGDEDSYGRQLEGLYTTRRLPKQHGGSRTLHVPVHHLKYVQRVLLDTLFANVEVSSDAHGFVRGRSVVTNAKVHENADVFVHLDIASFFDATSYASITNAARHALGDKATSRAVVLLAELCSYDRSLPTGAPTSPALANLILRPVDAALAAAAKRRSVRYSRYADDLSFSGSSEAVELIPFVQRVLAEHGYRLEAKKTNVFRRGRRQVVTGLVVNARATASRTYRRRLRAAVHRYTVTGTALWHGKAMTLRASVGFAGRIFSF